MYPFTLLDASWTNPKGKSELDPELSAHLCLQEPIIREKVQLYSTSL